MTADIQFSGQNNSTSLSGNIWQDNAGGKTVYYSGVKRVIQQGRLDSKKIGTDYYNEDTGKNFIRIGTMPDGTGNIIIMRDGFDVDEVFE